MIRRFYHNVYNNEICWLTTNSYIVLYKDGTLIETNLMRPNYLIKFSKRWYKLIYENI